MAITGYKTDFVEIHHHVDTRHRGTHLIRCGCKDGVVDSTHQALDRDHNFGIRGGRQCRKIIRRIDCHFVHPRLCGQYQGALFQVCFKSDLLVRQCFEGFEQDFGRDRYGAVGFAFHLHPCGYAGLQVGGRDGHVVFTDIDQEVFRDGQHRIGVDGAGYNIEMFQ